MNRVTIVENFYDNPEELIRKYAFCDQPSPCPGFRSKKLDIVDKNFYKWFRKTIFDLHGIEDSGKYQFTTYFNYVEPFEEDVLNYNWPHIDGDVRYGDTKLNHQNYEERMILGGHIMLSEVIDPNSSVTFWKMAPELNWSKEELFDKVLFNYITTRSKYEKSQITLEEYEKEFEEFHKCFVVDEKFPNEYNKLISWKAGTIRGGKMITKEQKTRLTHNFYIHV